MLPVTAACGSEDRDESSGVGAVDHYRCVVGSFGEWSFAPFTHTAPPFFRAFRMRHTLHLQSPRSAQVGQWFGHVRMGARSLIPHRPASHLDQNVTELERCARRLMLGDPLTPDVRVQP